MTMQNLKDKLESLIDSNSVATVLEAMSQICYEKSLHIQENWQDKSTAKHWDKAGNDISKLQDKIGC